MKMIVTYQFCPEYLNKYFAKAEVDGKSFAECSPHTFAHAKDKLIAAVTNYLHNKIAGPPPPDCEEVEISEEAIYANQS